MIGGTDIVIPARADIPAADVILRVVRRYWPQFVIQDADDDSAPFTAGQTPWLPSPAGSEFFVYRDEQAAVSWEDRGAEPENANTMLYVILSDEPQSESGLTCVTLVCTGLAGEMQAMIAEIEAAFRDAVGSLRSQSRLEVAA